MKKLLIITTIIFISTALNLKADYNGSRMSLSIEHINGQISKGYYELPSYVTDSTGADFLKTLLLVYPDLDLTGGFAYYKKRIKYQYSEMSDSSRIKHTIYCLADTTTLSFKLIKRITIEGIERFSYCIGIRIANELQSSDTTWMKKKPLRKVNFYGYLNSYKIFIHENSPGINELIKQLEKKQKEIESIEIIADDNSGGYSTNGHKIDDELWELIQKLNKLKVVVINKYDC